MRKSEEYLQLDPIVPITLKGKEYTLEMNNYAVKGIFLDTKYNIIQEGFKTEHRIDPFIMGAMLYWCLKTHHPDLSLEEVDKLFTYKQSPYVVTKLIDCIDLYLPGDENKSDKKEEVTVQDPQ